MIASRPHFTIIGAGAIGGVVGAHLARAGYAVLFVDRDSDHVAAINTNGLRVEGADDFVVRAPAVTPDALVGALRGQSPEVVLLAVKAQHTRSALEPAAAVLGEHGVVVSLQNGLNEHAIAARIGAAKTIGAFINFGGDYQAPGQVMFSGRHGEFYLGELDGHITPRVEALATIFRSTFLEHVQVTENIWGYLWGKMGYASMLFATAATDETMADALANHRYRPLLANIAGEVVRVADAEGVRCEGFAGYDPNVMRFATPRDWNGIHRVLDQRVAVNRQSLKQWSGIWRDLAVRQRPTEVDAQPGAVVEIGRKHGLTLPLHDRVIEIIHDLEAGRRRRGPEHLDELRALSIDVYGRDGETEP
jgi:2-dehydropantoate 2-reductase